MSITVDQIVDIYANPKFAEEVARDVAGNLHLLDVLKVSETATRGMEQIVSCANINAPQLQKPILKLLTWLKVDEEVKRLSNSTLSLRDCGVKDINKEGYDAVLECAKAVDEFYAWMQAGFSSMKDGAEIKKAIVDSVDANEEEQDQIRKRVMSMIATARAETLEDKVKNFIEKEDMRFEVYSNIDRYKGNLVFVSEAIPDASKYFSFFERAFEKGEAAIQEPYKNLVFVVTLEMMIIQTSNREKDLDSLGYPDMMKNAILSCCTAMDSIDNAREAASEKSTNAPAECCICLEAKPDAYFTPCAHNQMCFQCSRDLKVCPICRAEGFAKPQQQK